MSRRTATRRSATLFDQMLSSVSNVLAVVLVARVLQPDEFGRFALGYAALTLVLTLSRSYFGARISLAADRSSAQQTAVDAVAALGVLAPLLAGAVFVAAALAGGGQSLLLAAIVAVTTPIVCMQDALRFGAVSAGRPGGAVLSDGAWVLAMALPFVTGRDPSASQALALWLGAALLALLVALAATGLRPRLRAGLAQLRRRDDVGESLTFGAVVTSAATLCVLLVVAAAISPAGAGSLRGAATAMGPVNVLLAFTALGLTPALVRRSRAGDLRFCAATAAVLAGLTSLWGAVLLLLPAAAGRAAFGPSWDGIRGVLPWTVAEYLGLCLAASAVLGLKVRRQSVQILRQRAAAAFITVVGGGLAAVVLGEVWAVAAALAVAATVSALVGGRQLLHRPARDRRLGEPALRPVTGA